MVEEVVEDEFGKGEMAKGWRVSKWGRSCLAVGLSILSRMRSQ